ncbi:SDR family NAD(P)-dependent oxidoreductase [Streptomyces fractus]|uniref:SDR family NAD(P)-dependent oxidoreductase n=1 Tax=Streptomyces fractus TaxID=641806 RepID=UPI003CE6937E
MSTRVGADVERFAGKVALVTGAGSGMGAAVARQAVAEGARAVVLADVNGDGAAAVASELSTGCETRGGRSGIGCQGGVGRPAVS